MMKSYEISADLLQKVVDFLQRQPWNQVHFLLQELIRTTQEQEQQVQSALKPNGKRNRPIADEHKDA